VALGAVKQTLQVEVEAERLLLAYRTVPGDHPDHPALLLLGEVLCNADSSRLQKALLFETQQATACQASMTDLRGPALWELRVVLRPGVRAV
jgi:predicted Zn-dependent peptidase